MVRLLVPVHDGPRASSLPRLADRLPTFRVHPAKHNIGRGVVWRKIASVGRGSFVYMAIGSPCLVDSDSMRSFRVFSLAPCGVGETKPPVISCSFIHSSCATHLPPAFSSLHKFTGARANALHTQAGGRSHLRKRLHVQKYPRLSSSLGAHQLPVDSYLEHFFLARRAHLYSSSRSSSSRYRLHIKRYSERSIEAEHL